MPPCGCPQLEQGSGAAAVSIRRMFSLGQRVLDVATLPARAARTVAGALLPSSVDTTEHPKSTDVQQDPAPTTAEFHTESDMLATLRHAAAALWIGEDPERTWVLLEEQQLHSRIADLVLVRLDVRSVERRLGGGWDRPLTLPELQVMRLLRPDRNVSADAVAQRLSITPRHSSDLLRGLVADGYAERRGPNAFRRLAPVQPLIDRVITFEAKRDDPTGAISQARGHRAWADETYVAFDARFERRFVAQTAAFERLGVGLLELWPDRWLRVLRARPRRSRNRLEAGLIGERTLARLKGSPASERPERRLPHGHRLSAASEPIVAGPDTERLHTLLGHRGKS